MNRLLVVFAVALIAGVWSYTALVDTVWAKPGGGKPGGGGNQPPTHTLVYLGESIAWAINNAGTIVGRTVDHASYVINPVDTDSDGIGDIWFDDANGDDENDLVVIVGETNAARPVIEVSDISDTGQVVGYFHDVDLKFFGFFVSPIDTDGDGFVDTWYQDTDGDGENDLITLLPGQYEGNESYAGGVNNFGQIVGQVGLPSGGGMAVLWHEGQPVELGTLGGTNSGAWAINNAGEIVGSSHNVDGQERAFFLRPADFDGDGIGDTWFVDAGDGITNALMIDLGTLGGAGASARDINDNSQIAGSAMDSNARTVPVMWEVDAIGNVTISAITGYETKYSPVHALAINSTGVICGNAWTSHRVQGIKLPLVRGFLAENGVATWLSDLLGFSDPDFVSDLRDINDNGMAVGWFGGGPESDGAGIVIPLP